MTHESDVPTTVVAYSEQDSNQQLRETAETGSSDASTDADLTAIRELVLRAHPDVVPELITGSTVDGLLASIEPAEAAFRRISESLQTTAPASSPETPAVPAGGDRPMPVDPDRLPASEKIRRGLAHR